MSLVEATADFEDDAQAMSADGYSVVSQSWDQPDLTRALSILAFLFFVAGFVFSLFLLVVGVILTLLALALRRDGTLSVTYQRPTDIPPARTADPPKLPRGPIAVTHRRRRPPFKGSQGRDELHARDDDDVAPA